MLGDKLRKITKENNKRYKEVIEKIEHQLEESASNGKLECEIKFKDIDWGYDYIDDIIRYFEKNSIHVYKIESYFGGSLMFEW